jgi:predicted dinucleotide-binding enzyme
MRIGTLGAGLMAEALAARWAQQGHEVMVGGRDVAKAQILARKMGARAGSLREAAEFGHVVLLAIPWAGVGSALAAAGGSDGALAGKVLIDCTNPVEGERFTLITGEGHSIAEQLQEATDARVVKAFNLCHASVWETAGQVQLITPPRFDGRPLAVPFAGDDEGANDVARALITALECDPVEIGPLHRARHLEAMAATVISLLQARRDPLALFNLIDPQPAAAAAVKRSELPLSAVRQRLGQESAQPGARPGCSDGRVRPGRPVPSSPPGPPERLRSSFGVREGEDANPC